MNAEMMKARFGRMGARVAVRELRVRGRDRTPLTLDIRSDGDGEYFDVRVAAATGVEVVDVRRHDRHLLLQATAHNRRHFYLCGHDEQHWFAAAVPERAGNLVNVFAAMEALKPPEVLEAQRRQGVKGKDRYRRKNGAWVRQGEWFFIPVPDLHVRNKEVLNNEPLTRGEGSKPHFAQFLYRKGGETVYVCSKYPRGVSLSEYCNLIRKPRVKALSWRRMVRNPEAFVRGNISHVDHKTINLQVWHKVLMNTENQSEAKRHVVFLD